MITTRRRNGIGLAFVAAVGAVGGAREKIKFFPMFVHHSFDSIALIQYELARNFSKQPRRVAGGVAIRVVPRAIHSGRRCTRSGVNADPFP